MKGLLLSQVGGPLTVVDDLETPNPGKGQILVKSLATAINLVFVSQFSFSLPFSSPRIFSDPMF